MVPEYMHSLIPINRKTYTLCSPLVQLEPLTSREVVFRPGSRVFSNKKKVWSGFKNLNGSGLAMQSNFCAAYFAFQVLGIGTSSLCHCGNCNDLPILHRPQLYGNSTSDIFELDIWSVSFSMHDKAMSSSSLICSIETI